MRLEREGPAGLALVTPAGERWLVTDRGIASWSGNNDPWSGERGRWTTAALHREGASLLVRIVQVLDHEGGTERTHEATLRSDDGGRTWTPRVEAPLPGTPPLVELSTDPESLERLGDFRLVRRLASGSLGDLHEALDPDGERIVVRVLRASNEPDVRAALRELGPRLVRAVHRHLLRVRAVSELGPDGPWLIASDAVYGQTLEAAPVEPARAPFVADRLLLGLEALHAEGLVHGDVQPSTIFFDHGVPRLADAALGSVLGDRRGPRRTRSGVRIDLAFAPPELLTRRPLDVRSDVYALGACLFSMLAGQPPFWAESSVALGVAVATGQPARLPPSVSPALAAVVTRALAKRPEDRFPTAAAMREALARATS